MGRVFRASNLELLTALALLFLLGILAWLQYRWTGAVSRGEAARLHSSLEASLARFSADFDEEIARIFRLFSVSDEGLPDALAEWRDESHYPDLVDEVFAVRVGEGGELALARLEGDGSFRPVAWPEGLLPFREGLSRLRHAMLPRWGRAPPFGPPPPKPPLRVPLVSQEPLALFVPRSLEGRREPPSTIGSFVTLRRASIRDEVLPDLVTRYFGSEEGLSYDVVVLDENGEALLTTSEDAGSVVASPDASTRLFSMRRGYRSRRSSAPEGHYEAFVRHRAGSLEAAVEQVRRRNLAVGLGILGILGVAIVLVTTSARRARELSERKMEFVAGVSHELRTPIAVIRSAAQNLTDGSVAGSQKVKTYGALVEAQSRRLEELVEQVLELAGIQSERRRYRRERVSVRELVAAAVADSARDAKARNVPVETSGLEEDFVVLGEEDALRRALANLVANAVKHGGDDNAVSIEVRSEGSDVALSVADLGPGVDETERAHLFEPFFRGARARERQVPGSGLGLSLVEHIVREHGGRVDVSTNGGKGSRFTIVLPGAPRPEEG